MKFDSVLHLDLPIATITITKTTLKISVSPIDDNVSAGILQRNKIGINGILPFSYNTQ